MGQVEGKVAVVTGAASGIGAQCAKALAREGARVVLTDVDEAGGQAGAEAIRQAGGDAIYLAQDVTSEPGWVSLMKAVKKHAGRLDVMVANAGIAIRAALIEMTLADWRRQQAINCDGVFLAIKHAIPAMRRSGGGSIIVMSSVAGLRGSAGLGGYCASKGAVRLLAKAAALECALLGVNIRVNSVHPGIIETPIWGKMSGSEAVPRNEAVDLEAISRFAVPMARSGKPEDVANAVLFLASDASSYMTGTEVVVDGGMMSGQVVRA